MTNVARLGVEFDGSDLTAAEVQLRKVAMESAKTELATKRLEKTKTSAALSIARADHIAASAALKLARADKSSSMAHLESLGVNLRKAEATLNAARASDLSATASLQNAQAALQEAQALHRVAQAAQQAANDNNLLNQSLRDMGNTVGQVQSRTTNLVAQFQDIGVTASMGMNPMLIGMQQGAQIALVMQDAVGKRGLAGAMGELGKSFLSVLGPVTFLSIAFTAIMAALIQVVNWTKFAQGGLNLLADGLEAAGVQAVYFGGVLAIAFAPKIITSIYAMTVAIGKGLVGALMAATKWMIAFSIANPFTAFVLGVATGMAALYLFRDEIKRVFGYDLFAIIKDITNTIIRFFVAAFNTVVQTWRQLPGVFMGVLNRMSGMLNETVGFNLFPSTDKYEEDIKNVAAVARTELEKVASVDYVGLAADSISSGISAAAKKLRDLAASIGSGEDDDKKGKRDPWAELVKGTQIAIAALEHEARTMHLLGEAAEVARIEQELLTQAKQNDIVLTDKHRQFIAAAAQEIGKLTAANNNLRAGMEAVRETQERLANTQGEYKALQMGAVEAARFRAELKMLNDERFRGVTLNSQDRAEALKNEEIIARQILANEGLAAGIKAVKSAQEELIDIQTDRTAMNMSIEGAARYRMEMKILNDELFRNITLLPEQKQELINLAGSIAVQAEEMRQLNEQLDVQRDTFKGLFHDLRDGLMEGKSAWQSLADSVIGALTRIGDALIELWLNDALQGMLGGGKGGGFFGSLLGGVGSLIGANQGGIYAKGAAFDSAGVRAFASGGVVDSPTLFNYGGGQTGLMGEAGPEAILPLQRGPDGSLGVQMYGGAGGAGSRVHIHVTGEEGPMFRPTVEAIAEDKSVQITQAGIESYDSHMPERFQQIAGDERAR